MNYSVIHLLHAPLHIRRRYGTRVPDYNHESSGLEEHFVADQSHSLELDVSEQLTYQAQHIARRRSSVCVKIWIYTYELQGTD